MKTGWKIDRDYINDKDKHGYNRVGVKTKNWDTLDKSTAVRFRCKDDDGEIYYGGLLVDDDYANGQQSALDWCMADAGCTTIEVKINGEWKIEIG